jgi:hypothetical protein
METINLKTEGSRRYEQYSMEISYSFRALENLDAGVDTCIKSATESSRRDKHFSQREFLLCIGEA